MNELFTKFREAPGLMTLEEIIQVKNFLVEFINLFEIYSPSQPKDHMELSKNFVYSDIEKANWYFDWVQKQSGSN